MYVCIYMYICKAVKCIIGKSNAIIAVFADAQEDLLDNSCDFSQFDLLGKEKNL